MFFARLTAAAAASLILGLSTGAQAGEALAAPLPGATEAPKVVESTPAPEQSTEASQSVAPSEEPAGVQTLMPDMGGGGPGGCPHRRAKVEPTV